MHAMHRTDLEIRKKPRRNLGHRFGLAFPTSTATATANSTFANAQVVFHELLKVADTLRDIFCGDVRISEFALECACNSLVLLH